MPRIRICITGDDWLTSPDMFLRGEELATLKKVVNYLIPEGPYAPQIIITDLDEVERKRKEEEERKKEELKKKMGQIPSGPTSFELAFAAAKAKKER